ncbi:MAG TPA: hypothetical protein VMZ33_01925 [Candidatus Limnocylindrales bacterium]|nr:hypothetical protein [Candidatus Limnocylindrales bacterium]
MKGLIWLPVAGFLLVAGATVAAAAPGVADRAVSVFDADGSDTGPAPTTGEVRFGHEGGLLDEVLTELVDAGTITQAQSDAITEALTTKAEARHAEFEDQRDAWQATAEQIRTFLEDGVISADEIAQLPADNPFSELESILDDGQITLQELESVGPFGGRFLGGPGGEFDGRGPGGHGHGRGPRGPGGPGMWVPAPDEANAPSDASPEPSAS